MGTEGRIKAFFNGPLAASAIRFIGLGANLLMLLLAGRTLTIEAFGDLMVLLGTSGFLGLVFSIGLPGALCKHAVGPLKQNNTVLAHSIYRFCLTTVSLTAAVVTVLSGLALILTFWAFGAYRIGQAPPKLIFAIVVSGAAMAIFSVAFNALRCWKEVALSSIYQFLVTPFLLCAAFLIALALRIKVDRNLALVIYGCAVIVTAAGAVFTMYCIHPKFKAFTPYRVNWKETRSLWLLSLLGYAEMSMPFLVGTLVLTASEMADFGMSFRISSAPVGVIAAMATYYIPVIREKVLAGGKREALSELKQSQRHSFIILFPVTLIGVCFPEQIISIFRNDVQDAIRVFQVLLVGQLLVGSCGVVVPFLAMADLSHVANRLSVIFVLLGVLFLPVANYIGGMAAFAAAWVLVSVLKQLMLMKACLKE